MQPDQTTPSDLCGPGSTSSSLLRRVVARNPDDCRRLVHLYGPLVNHWLAKARLPEADAEDVWQDVFAAAFRAIDTLRRDRPGDSFRGWLWTIMKNKVVDHRRRLTTEPQGVGGSAALQRLVNVADPDVPDWDAPDEQEQRRALRHRALAYIQAEFERSTWEMFWRVTVEQRSTAEVAEEFGVTPAAVRMNKSRVLRRLREELEGLDT